MARGALSRRPIGVELDHVAGCRGGVRLTVGADCMLKGSRMPAAPAQRMRRDMKQADSSFAWWGSRCLLPPAVEADLTSCGVMSGLWLGIMRWASYRNDCCQHSCSRR